MRRLSYPLFLLTFATVSLFAQETTRFAHPIQIEPIEVYRKLRVNYTYWDMNYGGEKQFNRNTNLEGEFRFWDSFSVVSSVGRNDYIRTNSEREVTWDRYNLGIKYAKTYDLGGSQLLIGAGLRLYDQKRNALYRESENPEYYLIRPNFGIGWKKGLFEVMSEFRFQSETNRKGRESSLEEFRRYYQVGIAPSYGVFNSLRVFTEFEYREPFDKTIDTNTRFFNFYPGFTYKTESLGQFSFSALLSLLSIGDSMMDRGFRFSYFYFFDPN